MILIGALLMVVGLVLLLAQPLIDGQLSRGRDEARNLTTLEPPSSGRPFRFRISKPGAAIFAVGILLMLVPGLL